MNKRTTFTGDARREISFPLGGIGSGSIGLSGYGSLVDWEIYNRPNKCGDNGYTHFAVKATREGKKPDARVICGDRTDHLAGTTGHNFGFGLSSTTMQGFPHFRDCVFTGEFPIATVDFIDSTFP
ncbi:MAG: GH116 family glycosyl-hydrolase, partial [Eubacteriales bacterium]